MRTFHVVRVTKSARAGQGRWAVARRRDHWLDGALDLEIVDGEDRHYSKAQARARATELEATTRTEQP